MIRVTEQYQTLPSSIARPCPFCGSPAEITSWHGGAPTKVMIACVQANTEACEVGPQVTGETTEEGLEHWNRRATSSGEASR